MDGNIIVTVVVGGAVIGYVVYNAIEKLRCEGRVLYDV